MSKSSSATMRSILRDRMRYATAFTSPRRSWKLLTAKTSSHACRAHGSPSADSTVSR